MSLARRDGRIRGAVVTLLLATLAAVAGYTIGRSEPGAVRSAPTTTAPSSSTTTSTPITPTPPRSGLLAELIVDDDLGTDDYSRDAFPMWLDLDGDGCDARADVLMEESITPAQVDRTGSCAVLAGDWRSRYDGLEVSDPAELDVDHLVPLGEAWRSGARHWDAARRAEYANDVSHPDQLIAVTASSNRSKGDQDPANWRPPDRSTRCWYATTWIEVKHRWNMTVDTYERDALGQMLESC